MRMKNHTAAAAIMPISMPLNHLLHEKPFYEQDHSNREDRDGRCNHCARLPLATAKKYKTRKEDRDHNRLANLDAHVETEERQHETFARQSQLPQGG